MEKYSIRITRQAGEHLREIYRYIERELSAPIAAKNTMLALKNEMNSLATMPGRIHLTPEEPWHSLGIHRDRVKNYYIYFWINQATKQVEIIGIIYVKRDQMTRLGEIEF